MAGIDLLLLIYCKNKKPFISERLVGPPGLEPGTYCPESFRGSQDALYFSSNFKPKSGYFLRFEI
jgi:hypothetical protein